MCEAIRNCKAARHLAKEQKGAVCAIRSLASTPKDLSLCLPVRVALGARVRHVMRAAVGRPIVLLAVGSLLGLLTTLFASGLLSRVVDQADPRDPVVVTGAVLTMVLLGIAASAIPALRSLAVDPSKLMREE